MERERFEQLVDEGIAAIPEKFRRLLDNVAVVIEDEPPAGQDLLGLYEGVPKPERGHNYTSVLPDKITIFMNPVLEEAGGDGEMVRKIVRDTVWHEIAHHFGFDDEEIEAAEERRRVR